MAGRSRRGPDRSTTNEWPSSLQDRVNRAGARRGRLCRGNGIVIGRPGHRCGCGAAALSVLSRRPGRRHDPRHPAPARLAQGAVGIGAGHRLTPALGREVEDERAVDEGEVAEGLREVAQEGAVLRHLLGVEAEVVLERPQGVEPGPGLLDPAEPGQRVDEPEGADQERALVPRQPVVVAVAVDERAVAEGARSPPRPCGRRPPRRPENPPSGRSAGRVGIVAADILRVVAVRGVNPFAVDPGHDRVPRLAPVRPLAEQPDRPGRRRPSS